MSAIWTDTDKIRLRLIELGLCEVCAEPLDQHVTFCKPTPRYTNRDVGDECECPHCGFLFNQED